MDGDEIFVALISAVVAVVGSSTTTTAQMPALSLRKSRWIGVTRLATTTAMIWILVVLSKYADPSVKGIYVWFYLLMGYAVVKGFGTLGARGFGIRFRVDICERNNAAAAVFFAGFVLATGMIFGGCLWGEADPTGDDEGGWWIPVGFFLAGWCVLILSLAVFFWREPGSTGRRIRRDRHLPAARAAAVYALSAGWLLTDAVAGDFYGWKQGLLAVGGVAVLLLVHEAFAFGQTRLAAAVGQGADTRNWESVAYAMSGVALWWLNRFFESRLAAMA